MWWCLLCLCVFWSTLWSFSVYLMLGDICYIISLSGVRILSLHSSRSAKRSHAQTHRACGQSNAQVSQANYKSNQAVLSLFTQAIGINVLQTYTNKQGWKHSNAVKEEEMPASRLYTRVLQGGSLLQSPSEEICFKVSMGSRLLWDAFRSFYVGLWSPVLMFFGQVQQKLEFKSF